MGVVYEAQQEWPDRRVALKVLRGSYCADEYQIKLFQREVHALSRLKHRSIASIYDADYTDDGEPFFAMELIQGVPLNEFVRARSTPDHARLILMREICETINYAHQQGVIHRDIKPSNILIQENGTPKILDFGLARIVDGKTTAAAVMTTVEKLHGTLPYMSPERIRGNPLHVDLRSDVYALGVILYELMTDSLPFCQEDRSRQDLVDLICRGAVPKPGSVKRPFSSELETIIQKAVEKDVTHRYQSALALSEDIERFLTNQPIQARPPSAFYQLRKLVARHKLVGAMTATLLLLVMCFTVWMSALFARASQAEQRATDLLIDAKAARDNAAIQARMHQSEATHSKQVTAFLQQMLASIDPYSGARGNTTIQQMLDEASLCVTADLGRYPETEAAVRATLGSAYLKLGVMQQAQEHLQRALAIRRQLFGSEHLAVGDSLLRLARMHEEGGNISMAQALCWDFLTMKPEHLGSDLVAVAMARVELAELLSGTGDFDAADRVSREALSALRAVLPEDHPKVATGMRTWASVRYMVGDFDFARELAESAHTIFESKVSAEPAEVVQTLQLLTWIVRAQGEFAEAEALSRKALDTCRRRLGEEHPWVASCLFDLAHQRYDLGHLKEAEALFGQSLAVNRIFYDEDSPRTYDALNGLAGMRWAQGDYATAEQIFRNALAKTRERFGDRHPRTAGQLNTLAVVLRDQGDFDEAERLFHAALRLNRRFYGTGHRYTANILTNLARLHYLRNDFPAAEPLIRDALEIRKQQFNACHPEVAEAMMILGLTLMGLEDPASGKHLLEEALTIRESHFSEDHWLVAEAKSALAASLISLRDYEQAETLLLESMSVFTQQLEKGHKLIRQARGRLRHLRQIQESATSTESELVCLRWSDD